MKVIIITGNPKYINVPIARRYYRDIQGHLNSLGVRDVKFNVGEDYTCPPEADIYIAHSRGCGRLYRCDNMNVNNTVLLGVPEGIIHPIDLTWHKTWLETKGLGTPPDTHFLLFKEQRDAISALVNRHR